MDTNHATDVNNEFTSPTLTEEIKREENPIVVEEGKQQEFADSTISTTVEAVEPTHSSTTKIEDEKEKLQLDAETVSEHPPLESSVAQTAVSPDDSQNNSRNNSSELIVSETFVRIISKAVTQRVKIMQVLAVYFDDIVENENTLTKGLTKLGGLYNANLGMRIDWFQSSLSVVDDLIQKTLIQSTLKHHQAFSQQILTNSSKLFREIFKSYPQSIQQKMTYCLSLVEELKRAKTAHTKNLDKYAKLIRDTESQLRARENIIAANNIPTHESTTNGSDVPTTSTDSINNGDTTPTTPSTSSVKEDRFMGRSFSKMLSKMSGSSTVSNSTTGAASTQNPAEKKIEERCKELFKEIDIAERQLSANADSLTHYRNELLNTARRTIQELFETEFGRLSAFKDGLSSFMIHYETVVSSLFDSFSVISSQFSQILSESDMPPLMSYLTGSALLLDTTSCPSLQFITTSPEIHENFNTQKTEMMSWYIKISRLTDAYELIITLTSRASSLLDEVNDTDVAYYKGFQSLFDKNGFQRQPNDTNNYYALSKFNPLTSTSNTCGQLLSSLELPTMKKTFESFLQTITRLNDVITKTGESLKEEVLPQCARILKTLGNGKKEVQDKMTNVIKKLDTSFATLSKNRVELKKLKALLRERRQTVKAAREEVNGPSASTGSIAANASNDNRDSMNNNSDATDALRLTNQGITADPAISNDTVGTTDENNDELTAGTRRQSSILGATLSTVKLKQAVGFESASDRLVRIENQITSLEDKEVELTARCDVLYKTLLNDITTTRSDLESLFTSYTDILVTTLRDIKGVFDLLSKVEVSRYMTSRDLVKGLKDQITVKYNPNDDISTIRRFYHQYSSDGNARSNSSEGVEGANGVALTSPKDGGFSVSELLEIPTIESFKPIMNQTVMEGKIKLMTNVHHNPVLIAAVAELKQQKEKEKAEKEKAEKEQVEREREKENEKEREVIVTTQPTPAPPANTSPSTNGSLTIAEDIPVTPAAPVIPEVPPMSPPSSPDKTNQQANHSTPPSNPPAGVVDPPPTASPTLVMSPDTNQRVRKTSDISDDLASFDDVFSFVDAATNSKAFTTSSKKNSRSTPVPSSTASGANNSNSTSSSMISGSGRTTSGGGIGVNSGGAMVSTADPESELKKFGLSIYDKVLESFSCALYPKKGILTHGRMYITQHYVAFSGWPDTRVLLSMKRIDIINKSNTLMYIPNAITIQLYDKSEYFFASFIERDLCYQLLTNLMQVERRICELAGPDGVPDPPHLVFGYQHRSTILTSTKEVGGSGGGGDINDDDSGDGKVDPSEEEEEDEEEGEEEGFGEDDSHNKRLLSEEGNGVNGSDSSKFAPILTPPPTTPSLPPSSSAAVAAATPVITAPTTPAVPPRKKNPLPRPSIDQIYQKSTGVTQITRKTIKGTAADIWRHFWREGSGYRDFLQSTSDVTKSFSEWKCPNGNNSNQLITVNEDQTKTKYHYERDYDYDHTRTTMLMFGPKIAPTKLKQYISFYCDDVIEDEEWKDSANNPVIEPSSLIILNLSYCEGVPMADVFKVLQYWTFQTNPTNPTTVDITIGFGIFYIKSSMFKSQIASGAKDEMSKQIDDFLKYLPNLLAKQRAALATANALQMTSGGSVGTSSGVAEGSGDQAVADALLQGDSNNIVIITTTGDDVTGSTPQHKRQSRRLSLGNKSVTITTETAEEVPVTLLERVSAWSWQGIDLKTMIFALLVFLVFVQMRAIRSLTSEVREMKVVLQQAIQAMNQIPGQQ